MDGSQQGRITAVLGPTNTGKTHLAIERMLGHRSGIIGFPLRLLARENYDRALKLKGPRQVALVTGEEKIVPPGARYFFCTVESMPLDRPVDFLAVDEIQLAADPERGHVFTDRLLHARGAYETMFLGAGTIARLVRSLVPEAETLSRPRLSTLTYSGPKKVTRLPARSAVVVFSAAEVYQLAELIRRQRGGTAVVLGALSPRTRNAQVAMFEAGEVDYLVATDAIGMGLNLSLDHVAFARLGKFDGRFSRRLNPAEIAQIAGRAGRHMSDGTFGTTAELGPMEPELVEAVENHRFDPITAVFWRNPSLDFRSADRLLRSLERRPPDACLLRVREPDDQRSLLALARDAKVAKRATSTEAVALLWDVCQIPDFRKILSDQHTSFLAQVFLHLSDGDGRLPADWVARQIDRIDRDGGDIDVLVARIAQVRTWTYISHRAEWLEDAGHWQERTRALEDKLSDALHARLTQRFVDRRTAALVKRLKGGGDLVGALRSNGEVLVEGEFVGSLVGFRFHLDPEVTGGDAKAVLAAARRALTGAIPGHLRAFEAEADRAFTLDPKAGILWRRAPVARLTPGPDPLSPRIAPMDSEFLDGPARQRVCARLDTWLQSWLRQHLGPLFRLRDAELSGPARGLAFQLVESLGVVPRQEITTQARALSAAERKGLARLGIRLGGESVFLPGLLKPKASALRGLLLSVNQGWPLSALPALGRRSLVTGAACGDKLCRALGYRWFRGNQGGIGVRVDALERLARAARTLGRQGAFAPTPALWQLIDADASSLAIVLRALGYEPVDDVTGLAFRPPRAGTRRKQRKRRRRKPDDKQSHSPFAKLRELGMAK